jgi:hypothetical protein
MNIKVLSFSLLTPLLLFSCRKPVSPTEVKSDSAGVSKMSLLLDDIPPLKNYIILSFHKRAELPQYANPDNNSAGVAGAFFNAANNYVSVGNIHVGDLTISPNAAGTYSYASNMQGGGGTTKTAGVMGIDGAYGQDITVSIDGGNGYSGSSHTVHVPADLNVTPSAYEKFKWGSNLTLNWAPDPQNQLGEVLINVFYYPGLSRYQQSSNPVAISSLSYLVPDNGAYTIPGSAMSAFPEYSYIGYSVARANEYEVDPVQDIMIYTVVEVTSNAMLVIPESDIYIRFEKAGETTYSDPYITIRTADIYMRFYQDRLCTAPLTLWSDITAKYHYRFYQWSDPGWSDEFNEDVNLQVQRGTQQYYFGNVETYFYDRSAGNGYTNEYSMLPAPNYAVTN